MFTSNRDGFYDENGTWIRAKLCFTDCGDRCTCTPPNGVWQLNIDKVEELNRTIEQLVGKMWLPVEFKDLKVKDIFRMFEANGDPVDGGERWIVNELPYLIDGVWGVSCEVLKGVYYVE